MVVLFEGLLDRTLCRFERAPGLPHPGEITSFGRSALVDCARSRR
jgi:hypothetical protein